MNKGILQLALSGAMELELEYREPGSKENDSTNEHSAAAQQSDRIHAQEQIADAFAWLLHVI